MTGGAAGPAGVVRCLGSGLPPALTSKHWDRCGYCGRDFAHKLDGTVRRHALRDDPVIHKTTRPRDSRYPLVTPRSI